MALLGEIIKGVNYFSVCLGVCGFTCSLLYFCIRAAFNFEGHLWLLLLAQCRLTSALSSHT